MKRNLYRRTLFVLLLLVAMSASELTICAAWGAAGAPSGAPESQPAGQWMELRLDAIPTRAERARLEGLGIRLEEWLTGTTYWAYVPQGALKSLRQRTAPDGTATYEVAPRVRGAKGLSLAPVQRSWHAKLGLGLLEGDAPEWAQAEGGRWEVALFYAKGVEEQVVLHHVEALRATLVESVSALRYVRIAIDPDQLETLATPNWVQHLDFVSPPEELDNEPGASMIRARALQSKLPGRRGLTGKGVTVGIFDANLQDHIDFSGRLTIRGTHPKGVSDHGNHVTGTVAGAGILDPYARGMAPEAELFSWSFLGGNTQNYMLEGYLKDGIRITQNSYGVDLKNYCSNRSILAYNSDARTIDLLSQLVPDLSHIYAAGNYQDGCKGTAAYMGGYSSCTRLSKNIITVAALKADETMTDFSSWGPLPDGRLAPQIAATGYGVWSTVYGNGYDAMNGTSMACPSISGLTAQLHQFYMETNGGQSPHFVLVKAALLNTARDLGNVGPDYQFGYGAADGEKAVNLLAEKRYKEGKVAQGEEKTFDIDVPDGVRSVRVMLVWHDAPGQGDAGDLIDDLDLTVKNGGSVYYPWVLDPYNPSAPAKRGVDRVNNIEQVLIETPTKGKYTVCVTGRQVPSSEVEYAVTYEYDKPTLRVVYPNGGEIIDANDPLLVRWEAAPGQPLTIYYSDGAGAAFQPLAHVADAGVGLQSVKLPAGVALGAKARIRIAAGGHFDDSDTPFTLSARPKDVTQSASPCSSSATISWKKSDGVAGYELLRYDETSRKMVLAQKLHGADNTSCDIDNSDPQTPLFVAVRSVNADGSHSMQSTGRVVNLSYTLLFGAAGKELPFRQDVAEGYSPYLTTTIGSYVRSEVMDLGGKTGKLLVIKGYIDTYDDFKWDGDLFATNPEFVLSATMCIDFTKLRAGTKFNLVTPAILTPYDKTTEKRVGHRVVVVDGSNSEVLVDAKGFDVAHETTWRTYDMSRFVGKKIVLRVEVYAVAGDKIGGKNSFDVAGIGPLKFVALEDDLAVEGLELPANSTSLTSNETIKVLVRNHSDSPVNGASLKVEVNGVVQKNSALKELKELSLTKVEVKGVDFSKPDTRFEVVATVVYPGDVKPDNNSMTREVYNLGDYYLMPDAPTGYSNPEEKAVGATDIRFTDNGARLLDYKAGQNGIVLFKPETAGKRVKIVFESVDLADGDRLLVRNGAKSNSEVLYAFSGKQTDPVTVVSTAPGGYYGLVAGALYVEFECESGASAPGWIATVSQTDDATLLGEVNNTFSNCDVKVDKADYTTTPVTVKVSFTNTSKQSQPGVQLGYRVNGGNWIKETMSQEAKPGSNTYEFTQKANLQKWPKVYTLEGRVFTEDGYNEDNASSKREVISDKYPLTAVGNSSYPGYFFMKSVAMGDVVKPTSKSKGGAMVPQYFRTTVFTQYKDVPEPFVVEVVDPKSQGGKLYAWVDWDKNFAFDVATEAITPVDVPKRGGRVELPMTLPAGIAAGDYNVRIATYAGAKPLDVTNEKSLGVSSGEVEDYTLRVVEAYPVKHDLEVVSVRLSQGFTAAEKVTVRLRNNGSEAIATPRYSITLEGQTPIAEESSVELAPFAEGDYVATATIDLSAAGKHVVLVEAKLDGDENVDNDTKRVEIINRNVTAGTESYVLAFDGHDDYMKVSGINSQLNSFTYESWVRLDSWGGYGSVGFGRIFDGKGLILFTNGLQVGGVYPYRALIVSVGGKNFHTDANTLSLHSWTHVAVTYAAGVTAPLLYLNGEPVELKALQANGASEKQIGAFPAADSPLYIGNSAKGDRQFCGALDGVRVWEAVRSQQEIKDNMYTICSASPAMKLQFAFNEGLYAKQTASTGSALVGKLFNMDTDNEGGAWQPEPMPDFASLTVEGQVSEWSKEGDTWKTEVSAGTDLTSAKLNYTLNMAGATATHAGVAIPANVNLTAPYAVQIAAPWIGGNKTSDLNISVQQEASTECKLLTLELGAPFGKRYATAVPTELELQAAFGAALSAVPATFTVSPGATLYQGPRPISSGGTLDLSTPARLTVVAANGRNTTEYNLRVRYQDPITWDQLFSDVHYGDEDIALGATTAHGAPIAYTATPENLVRIVHGKMTAIGVGDVTITAIQPGNDAIEPADPVAKQITIAKRPLEVKANDISVEYLEPIPVLTYTITGFAFGEDESVLDGKPTITTTATLGSVPKVYDIVVSCAADKHYSPTCTNGKLTITPAQAYDVTFIVTFNGSAKKGATIKVGGQEKQTGSDGKVTLKLKVGTYKWQCEATGTEPQEGKVEVVDRNLEKSVVLTPPLPVFTLTYTSDPEGKIEGETPQNIKQGQDGTPVTAVANTGYKFKEWNDHSTENPRTDKNVQETKTFNATYEKQEYTLTYSAGTNGKIKSGEAVQHVKYMESGTPVEVEADAGYIFASWNDGNISNPRTDENVTRNLDLVAQWKKIYTAPYSQNFDACTGVVPPADWESESKNAQNDNGKWNFKQTGNSYQFPSLTSLAAVADFGAYGFNKPFDATLRSPLFDFSANSSVKVEFRYNLQSASYRPATLQFGYTLLDGTQKELKKIETTSNGFVEYAEELDELVGKKGVQFYWQAIAKNGSFDYAIVDDFNVTGVVAAGEYELVYRAGDHGKLLYNGSEVAEVKETVTAGQDGPSVEVKPDNGYTFHGWSDGITANPRQDKSVKPIDATALYAMECTPITTYPYMQNFDGDPLLECWETPEGTSGIKWVFASGSESFGGSGKVAVGNAKQATYGTTATIELITPTFNLTSLSDPHLSFMHMFRGYNWANEKAKIEVSTDGGATWSIFHNFEGGDGQLVKKIELTAKDKVRFKFVYTGESWNNGLEIDDFKITDGAPVPIYNVEYYAQYKKSKDAEGYTVFIDFGKIDGQAMQYIEKGKDGTEVKAVANEGYRFTQWVDGLTSTTRTATNVQRDTSYEAQFVRVFKLVNPLVANGAVQVVANPGGAIAHEGIIDTMATVTITSVPNTGYKTKSLKVNGQDFVSGETLVVESDIVVAVEYESDGTTPVDEYTLTIAAGANGTVKVAKDSKDGAVLDNGAKIHKDDKLYIEATPAQGYTLETLEVNGTAFTSGQVYTVSGDVSVKATFKAGTTPPPVTTYHLAIAPTSNGTIEVLRGTDALVDGAELHKDDALTISATPAQGYTLETLEVNGEAFTSGELYTVSGDVSVKATFKEVPPAPPVTTYHLAIAPTSNGTIEVLRGTESLGDGAELHKDDALTISAKAADGYTLETLEVNGEAFTSGELYTVSGDVSVKATFKAEAPAPSVKYLLTILVQSANAPVEGATIAIASQKLTTDAGGKATIELPDGAYPFTVEKADYQSYTGNVTVAGAAKTVNVTLDRIATTPVEAPLLADVEVYPNPVSTLLTLKHAENVERITIINGTGQRVSQLLHDRSNERAIDVSHLADGVYILIVEGAGQSKTLRIVKSR